MENQHKLIKGYRDLSQDEINLMNEAKELAEKCEEFLEKVNTFNYDPKTAGDGIDPRWLSVGKTHLQQGFMAVIRSIAKPSTF